MSSYLEVAVIAVLTLANGVFAGAEIALISIRPTRVRELASTGAGKALERLRENPERFLATVQIGITIVSSSAAAFGGATLAKRLATVLVAAGVAETTSDELALGIVVVSLSFVSLVLGELVPKSLALKWSERYALLIARPLLWLSRIAGPIVSVLTATSNLVLRLFRDSTSFTETRVSRDELLEFLGQAAEGGELSNRAGEIASRAIDLDGLYVASVMTPRNAIVAIDAGSTPEALAARLDASDEERFPVRKGDDYVGYVATRDIARLLAGSVGPDLAAIVRPAHAVPGTITALEALEQLQSRRIPLAIVVGEAGGVDGIVDIDDLAEEIVGSLLIGRSQSESILTHEPDGALVVPATMRVHVANRELGLELPTSPHWSSLGGFMIARLERLPVVGDRVELEDGSVIEVVAATARRVQRLRIRKGAAGEVSGPSTSALASP